jgi:hypothetical protein
MHPRSRLTHWEKTSVCVSKWKWVTETARANALHVSALTTLSKKSEIRMRTSASVQAPDLHEIWDKERKRERGREREGGRERERERNTTTTNR